MSEEVIVRFKDDDGDTLVVEEDMSVEYCPSGDRVFIGTPAYGVFLNVKQIKKLRKALKEWLIEKGHKAGKDGWEANGGI